MSPECSVGCAMDLRFYIDPERAIHTFSAMTWQSMKLKTFWLTEEKTTRPVTILVLRLDKPGAGATSWWSIDETVKPAGSP